MNCMGNGRQIVISKASRSSARGRLAGIAAMSLVLALGSPALAFAAGNGQKTSVPTVQKQVAEVSPNGHRSWGETADAGVGESVDYRVIGTLPSNWDEFDAYRYEFHDDFSAEMSVDAGSIKVVIKDGDKEPLDVTDAFRVEVVGHGLSVSSVDLKAAAPAVSKNGKVILTYSASIVPDGATAGPAHPKKNFAHIVYTAQAGTKGAESGDTAKTKEDGATVYTWALELNKVSKDSAAPLEGAKFALRDADGAYIAANGARSKEPVELVTDRDGVVRVSGLDAGTYELRETEAPSGYEVMADPVSVTIASEFEGGAPVLSARENGNLTTVQVDETTGDVVLTVQNRVSAPGADDPVRPSEPVKPGSGDSGQGKPHAGGNAHPGGLSQTGDTQMMTIVVLGGAGVAAVCAAVALRGRGKREQD